MPPAARRLLPWLLAGLLATLLGAALLWWRDDAARREAFDTNARIAHRLLSQRALQHEAVLATLTLLQPEPQGAHDPARRLPALIPSVRALQRRAGGAVWPEPALIEAEARSRSAGRAVLASVDPLTARAWVLRAGAPASFALQVDLRQLLGEPDWPLAADTPVSVRLVAGETVIALQGPDAAPAGLGGYAAHKRLAAESQPFELQLRQTWGWAELPWLGWAAWAAACGLMTSLAAAWQRQRQARLRAEDLLRLGQVTRLNTLGELAAGMAHELNQPLTAVLANTQAARRLLAEEPPELGTARQAMDQAAAQARRASQVLGRLREALQRPQDGQALRTLRLEDAARAALHLLEPECRALGLQARIDLEASPWVQADPVALEQILHNLLRNALQSLAQVPPTQRALWLQLSADATRGHLTVHDRGEGIAPELGDRLFQPFASRREGGLGLGLSLSESLAQAQGGALVLWPQTGPGAAFRLSLPLAAAETP